MSLQTTFQSRHDGNQKLNRVFRDPNELGAGAPAPSAAWLAAQLAFTAALPKQRAISPGIVVRKTRVAVAAETGLENVLGNVVAVERSKSPRVFLIETAKPVAQRVAPSGAAQADLGAMLAVAATNTVRSTVRSTVRKRRVLSAAHIPGPVLLIFHAERTTAASAQSTDAAAKLSPVEATRLLDRLRLVARTLEDSARAADVSFVHSHEARTLRQLCDGLLLMRQQAVALAALGCARQSGSRGLHRT